MTFATRPISDLAPPLSAAGKRDASDLVRIGSIARRSFGVLASAPATAQVRLAEEEIFRASLALAPEA